MIMRPKKKIAEAEKNMEESKEIKYPVKYYIVEIGIMLLGALGMWFTGLHKAWSENVLAANTILTILGLAAVGFQFRNAFFRGNLEYHNGNRIYRFWIVLGVGLLLAWGCSFMPRTGWPFVPLFVILVLCSETVTGALAGTVLLLIATLLSGGTIACFALYLVACLFATVLFQRPEKDFKIGFPLFLFTLCLMMCLAVYVVLLSEEALDFDAIAIPVTNVILSAVLVIVSIKLFMAKVVYKDWNSYVEINNAENPVLVSLKEKREQDYMRSVHIAHFCECLGEEFELDTDALKCAAYYHCLGEELKDVMEEYRFPQAAVDILSEYAGNKNKPKRKETAVLLCAETIISGIGFLLKRAQEKQVDFEKAVDTIFRKLWENGFFDDSALSVAQIHTMQKIFKEEKEYYDILCRK